MSTNKRIYQIDLFRFIAAISVVLYHYLFRGYAADDMSILDFNEIGDYFKYGYLGVNLFFILSGFVITMSIQHGSLIKFAISRIVRLYPVYWLCVLLTFFIILFFGAPSYFVSLKQLFFNLTMFQDYVGVESIDGVYWSLVVEMKFYILIGIFLITNKVKRLSLDNFLYVWLLLSISYVFVNQEVYIIRLAKYFLILDWSSYFIAGIVFSQILKDGYKLKHGVLLAICLALSFYHLMGVVEEFKMHYHTYFSTVIPFIAVSIFFVIMLLISTHNLNFLNSRKFLKLGMLTYPLYLIHQVIGFIIFNQLGLYVDKYVLLVSTIALMIFISYLISDRIEPTLGNPMRIKLNELRMKFKLFGVEPIADTRQ